LKRLREKKKEHCYQRMLMRELERRLPTWLNNCLKKFLCAHVFNPRSASDPRKGNRIVCEQLRAKSAEPAMLRQNEASFQGGLRCSSWGQAEWIVSATLNGLFDNGITINGIILRFLTSSGAQRSMMNHHLAISDKANGWLLCEIKILNFILAFLDSCFSWESNA
jgi:hypothetical protein